MIDPGGIWVCSIPNEKLNPDAEEQQFVVLRVTFIKEYNLEKDPVKKREILNKYIQEVETLTGIKIKFLPPEASGEDVKKASEAITK